MHHHRYGTAQQKQTNQQLTASLVATKFPTATHTRNEYEGLYTASE